MIRKEAGLAFWLDWVEHRGGLWEDAGDTALALLPAVLASELELPEETAVTADPDVAREDGALLLVTGHPMVAKAAESVLAAGDTGTLTLAAPRSVPPDAATLLSKAREHLPVDHGRLDPRADATLERALRPVLRVGALVGYELSAEDHFQEQAEVFVDVPSRLRMPAGVSERLARTGHDPRAESALPAGLAAALDYASTSRPDLAAALAEAHRMLEAAAVLRRDGLAAQIGDAYAKERARAEEYYAAAVDSLQRRAATAPEDRAALLRARIESTREERARRLAEIAEKYRARHTLTPYRLHLLRVPVLRLALDVRRGERRYPLDLDWLLPAGEFAPLRCPACARSGAQLVAAKTHLGCDRCLAPKRPTPRPAPESVPPPRDGAATHTAVSAERAAAPVRAGATPAAGPSAARNAEVTGGAGPRSRGEAKAGRIAEASAARAASARSVAPGHAQSPPQRRSADPQTLRKRAFTFWEHAAGGDRRKLERLCAPDSPAAALLRLYGAAGPLYGIGVGSRERVESCSVAVFPAEGRRGWDSAGGEVHTDRGRHDYLLRWSLGPDQLIVEVLPHRTPFAMNASTMMARYRSGGTEPATRLPRTGAELDPVAHLLWQHTPARHGAHLAARALASWWRLTDPQALRERYPAAVLAAAAERSACYWSGVGAGGYGDAARLWQVPEADLRKAGTHLQRLLKATQDQPW
ncbi:hypothetical protein F9278_28435 [Streptomyces phaeolivaceus]|uniref:Uncharacterized protein n=1 Tax=Streptomyces phaeolivaceus TaxID=2653200 RepID=A0A5P8K8T2_9ACTN|nr:hypothetical protein [Streptomyces phaeolivaceus]QFQ99430.1 hypothetical protein F9278_28435 [Streptomyces phaeolivaceus]